MAGKGISRHFPSQRNVWISYLFWAGRTPFSMQWALLGESMGGCWEWPHPANLCGAQWCAKFFQTKTLNMKDMKGLCFVSFTQGCKGIHPPVDTTDCCIFKKLCIFEKTLRGFISFLKKNWRPPQGGDSPFLQRVIWHKEPEKGWRLKKGHRICAKKASLIFEDL